ncbi:MAG: hypothetical protein CM15mP84_09650 [Cellvibrionales bacterium]|nr:MAG: hypothetical protein CM15mP84_09650 [Cellvibrionales bacterium]
MNKPVFPSYQELLNEEAVSVPDALRLDTRPNIANDIIATDVWTDRGVFEKRSSTSGPKFGRWYVARPRFRRQGITMSMTLPVLDIAGAHRSLGAERVP